MSHVAQAHTWLLEIAQHLDDEPTPASGTEPAPSQPGSQVQQQVETVLATIETAVATSTIPDWLHGPMTHLTTVLRRLAPGLYQCYDVPGLPRTNNAMEQFYRRIKTSQRRITGHKRADAFVVRVGGFAVYAMQAATRSPAEVQQQLSAVPASAWHHHRAILRANQQRQTQMRRFRLHRDSYLADLEARWIQLADPP
jgi:hypothetical protein